MGFGDCLIAAGQAQEIYDSHPDLGPVTICASDGSVRWQPVWEGNPAVYKPTGSRIPPFRRPFIITGKGHLPYLRYPYTIDSGWQFTNWRVRDHRPRLYLNEMEVDMGVKMRALLGSYIVLEPTAERKHINRRPLRRFWAELLTKLRDVGLPIVQLAHPQADLLPDVYYAMHDGFRQACGILSGAAVLVSTEGGLVHAAAALGTPTVALYGGCISVDALGYPEHTNIVDRAPETPCGSLLECPHCAAAWARVKAKDVVAAVSRTLMVHAGAVQ